MKKPKFSLARKDEEMLELIKMTGHKTLGIWAHDCALRVLPNFEKNHPKDKRPRIALETLKGWIGTGEFRMAVIRKASLDAHAAAREVGRDDSARSAARAAGQAVATAHVPSHAYGSAMYAQQAVFRAADPEKSEVTALKERDWQYKHLLALRLKYKNPASTGLWRGKE